MRGVLLALLFAHVVACHGSRSQRVDAPMTDAQIDGASCGSGQLLCQDNNVYTYAGSTYAFDHACCHGMACVDGFGNDCRPVLDGCASEDSKCIGNEIY